MELEQQHVRTIHTVLGGISKERQALSGMREQLLLTGGACFKNSFEKVTLYCQDFRREARARDTGRGFGTVDHRQQP